MQLHRECIELIGEAWDIPAEEQRELLGLLEEEQASLRSGKGHVLLEEELPMNASGMETLDNVCGLFETAVQLESRDHREALFRLASKLMETQNLLDWIEKTPEEQELPELAES